MLGLYPLHADSIRGSFLIGVGDVGAKDLQHIRSVDVEDSVIYSTQRHESYFDATKDLTGKA